MTKTNRSPEELEKRRISQRIYYQKNKDYYKMKSYEYMDKDRDEHNRKRRERWAKSREHIPPKPVYTIEDMKKFAEEKNGKCLSNEYNGLYEKLEWQCECGYKWFSKPYNVYKRGQWCPSCKIKVINDKRKPQYEDLLKLAKDNEGKVLSDISEYKNYESKLQWQCKFGHIFESSFNQVKNNKQWCPKCQIGLNETICRFIIETLTGKEFSKIRPSWLINPKTGKRLELDGYNEELQLAFEYNGDQHYNNNIFFTSVDTLNDIQYRDSQKLKQSSDRGIKICIINFSKDREDYIKTIKDFLIENKVDIIRDVDLRDFKKTDYVRQIQFSDFLESFGYKLISPFHTMRTNVTVKCRNGHEWTTQARAIKDGNRCRKCKNIEKYTLDEIDRAAEKLNMVRLSKDFINNHAYLKVKCNKCGKIEDILASEIIRGRACCAI